MSCYLSWLKWNYTHFNNYNDKKNNLLQSGNSHMAKKQSERKISQIALPEFEQERM